MSICSISSTNRFLKDFNKIIRLCDLKKLSSLFELIKKIK